MEVAQTLDAADLPAKRPYLDQMSLPLAIQKAGLAWNILPDAQHFILGGKTRGEPLPQDRDIYAVHYRQWPLIKELGLSAYAKQLLVTHAGIKKVALTDAGEDDQRAQRRQRRTEKLLSRGTRAEASGATSDPEGPVRESEDRKTRDSESNAARKERNLTRAAKKAASVQAKPEAQAKPQEQAKPEAAE